MATSKQSNNNFFDFYEEPGTKKENRKITQTKQSLAIALLQLLTTKDINSIDVSELCKLAKINRTTFYKHYSNINDVLDELITDFFTRIKYFFTKNIHAENTTAKVVILLQFLKKNRTFIEVVMNNNFHDVIINKLYELDFVTSLLNKNLQYRKSIYVKEDYYTGFIISGWYAVIRKWIIERCDLDENTLARLLTSIY